MPVTRPVITLVVITVVSPVIGVGLVIGARIIVVMGSISGVITVRIIGAVVIIGAIGIVALTVIGMLAAVTVIVTILYRTASRRSRITGRNKNELQQDQCCHDNDDFFHSASLLT